MIKTGVGFLRPGEHSGGDVRKTMALTYRCRFSWLRTTTRPLSSCNPYWGVRIASGSSALVMIHTSWSSAEAGRPKKVRRKNGRTSGFNWSGLRRPARWSRADAAKGPAALSVVTSESGTKRTWRCCHRMSVV